MPRGPLVVIAGEPSVDDGFLQISSEAQRKVTVNTSRLVHLCPLPLLRCLPENVRFGLLRPGESLCHSR